MERIYKILPKYAFIPIISCLLLNSITYFGSRIFTTGMHHYDISIAIDRMLPFVTPMVSVYVLAYVTWILGFIIIGRESKKLCYEVCSAEMIGDISTYITEQGEPAFREKEAEMIAKLICLVCFIIMPTTLTRPEITGTGFWNWLTSLIYSTDAADNLFPSIHCLESWILFRGVMRCEKQGTAMKIFMFVSAILVFASTVLIKQHVVIDIIGGVLVVEIGLFLAKKLNTKRIFYAIENKLGLE